MAKSYIARVVVHAFVGGKRVEVPPGKPLPDGIHDHDIEELKRLRAIEDPDEMAAAAKDAVKAARAATADFEKARESVKAAADSIKVVDPQTPAPPPAANNPGGDGKAAGKRQAAGDKKPT